MAFPGTYNINYYKGDTFEFRVYPKDASGAAFPLGQYVAPAGLVRFTIAPAYGELKEGQTAVKGYAEISNDQTNILCVITPTNGNSLVAGTTYVYDIEIARESTPYNYIYTLLTGTVTVSAQVSQPTLSIATLKPNHISNLTQTGSTSTSVSLSWTAPTADASYGEATTYEGYILEVTDNILIIGAALQAGPVKTVETTEITFEWLDSAETVALSPETAYMVAIIASNLGGDASIATWTDLPTAIASGAVLAPVLTLGESS